MQKPGADQCDKAQHVPTATAAALLPDADHINSFQDFQYQPSHELQQALPPLHSLLHVAGLPLLPLLEPQNPGTDDMDTDDDAAAAADAAAVLQSLSTSRPFSDSAPQPAPSAHDSGTTDDGATANERAAGTATGCSGRMKSVDIKPDPDHIAGRDQHHKYASCTGNSAMMDADVGWQQHPKQQPAAVQRSLHHEELPPLTEGAAAMLDGTSCSFYLGDVIARGHLCTLYEARLPDSGRICAIKLYECAAVQQLDQQRLQALEWQLQAVGTLQQSQHLGPASAGAVQEALQRAAQEEEGTLLWLARQNCPHVIRWA